MAANPFLDRLRWSTDPDVAVPSALSALCDSTRVMTAREDVFRQGEGKGFLHVVLEGWVARYRELADGRRQICAVILPGDVCDLDRLMLSRVNFGASALSPCTIARVPIDRLRRLIHEAPGLSSALWRLLALENAVANEWATSLGRRTAQERLAHLFCEIAARLANGAPVKRDLGLLMTQQEMADALGLSAVHVNRSMQAMQKEKLIAISRRRIIFLDWEKLCRLAEFDSSYLQPPSDAVEAGAAAPEIISLRRRLGEREAELRELNHRIANSLQIAASLLARERRRLVDYEGREALAAAQSRLEAVGKVHRHLYRHSEKSDVDLGVFLESLCPDIARSAGLGCSIDADTAVVPSEVAQTLAVIVNELALNARKHAYPDGAPGDLRIELRAEGNTLQLRVSDDGDGFASDFDPAQSGGLGLSLVMGLAGQLNGVLDIETNHGAHFLLRFPLAGKRSEVAC